MAALDALLNSRAVEGPLAPLERKTSDAQRWSPQFGAGARPGQRQPVSLGPILAKVGIILAVSALAVAGAWYLRERTRTAAQASTDPPPALPSPLPKTLPPDPTLAAPPSSPPTTEARPSPLPTAAVLPSPRSATPPSPPPTSPPPPPPGNGSNLDQARRLMGRGDLDAAARDFATNVRRAPAGTLSIQLLVACSADTVQKAVASTSSTELYILPVSFKGRDCYRLCWGLYPSEARATSALGALPDYFRKNGATPKVAPAGQLLP